MYHKTLNAANFMVNSFITISKEIMRIQIRPINCVQIGKDLKKFLVICF